MSDTLIISDLHLSATRPATVGLFLHFLREQAATARRLYILGDLFDAWIGDDDNSPPVPEIIDGLRQRTQAGCDIYLMHGNRDFLLGEQFASQTGCSLIPDPYLADFDGQSTLLMHGDLLCSDDREYQQARQLLRSPAFIEDFIRRPIAERIQLAAEYRKRSGEVISLKSADIMDVNQQTVEAYMRRHRVKRMIHGHTHRPALHRFELDGRSAERHVLADWHEDAGFFLRVGSEGINQEKFS